MEPILNAKPFDILVTNVEKEHGLVKVFGQVDLQTCQVVDKYLRSVEDQLEAGPGPGLAQLKAGQPVVVRRPGGGWVRAKVVSTDIGAKRAVVSLVDLGITLPLAPANIRTGGHGQISQIQPLAASFFLGEVVPPGGNWSKPAIEFISDAVVGVGLSHALVTHRGHGHTFIRLYAGDSREPLSSDMVQCGMAVSGLPNIDFLPPAPHYVQPSVPPVAPLQPLYPVPGPGPAPVSPNFPPPLSVRVPPMPPPEYLPTQPPPSVIFRPMHLETGQWYPVYLSATEGGPGDFCIQLESLSKRLEEVMAAANNTQLHPIPAQSIQAGVPCLARYSLDNTIYRAVVLKKDSSAKVYYLDFGNSEQVPLDRVYAMPSEQLATQMLSVRCSIYQWPGLAPGERQRAKLRLETFCDRVIQCRVVSTETGASFSSAKTIVQLYEDGQDIGQEIRLWLARPSEATETWRSGPGGVAGYGHLTITGTCDVYLSHPTNGPAEFYVSRCDTSTALAAVMRDIHELSQTGKLFPLNSAQVGAACLARFSDNVWYRAEVMAVSYDRSEVTVYYVDYGNSSTVPLASIGVIPGGLVTKLPAQAVQCRLSGVHSVTGELMDTWRRVISEKIRIKVEGVDGGVHVVQATTLPLPGVNIGQELCGGRPRGGTGGVTMGEDEEVQVSWVESSNNWYGQLAGARAELREFLARMSSECHRQGQLLYRERESRAEQRRGEICAVMDNNRHSNNRYLRAMVLREHKDSVEVRLMDVGGRDKVSKNQVFSLPFEFSKRPEFGMICSFGCNPALADNKLKDVMINANLEVRIVKKIGDGFEVSLTNSKSRKLKNHAVGSVLDSLISGDSKLNQLYERQNSKQNNKINSQHHQANGHGGPPPVFERGDLRNSLREKRAARDREQQRAMLEGGKPSRGLGLPSFKTGWRGEGKITWMYSPGHFYVQVDRDRRQFEDMMGGLQEAMAGSRRQETWRQGQVVAARWSDNCWYRGQVTGNKQRKCEVFFVDFGNTEKVDKEDLGVLPSEFCHLDCQAVRVVLDGVEADWEKLEGKLGKFFDREYYSVEFTGPKDKDGAYPVHLNEGDIARAIVIQKLGRAKEASDDKNGTSNRKQKKEKERKDKEASTESDKTSNKLSKKNEKNKKDKSEDKENINRNASFSSGQEEKLSRTAKLRRAGKLFTLGDFPGIDSNEYLGNLVTGQASHVRGWKELWVQVNPDTAAQMRERLNTGPEVPGPVHGKVVKSIEEGECCVVEHEGQWFRATVTEKLEGGASVGVVMVDWGTATTLPLAKVRDGDFALYDLAPAALRCRLDNRLDNLERFIDNGKVSVRVKTFKENTFIVRLDKKGKKDKGKDESKARQDVVVVHVERVDRVWIVKKEVMTELEETMKALSEIETVTKTDVKVGDWCCARFSEDNELYRAIVSEISEGDGGVNITFVDYGNSETVEAAEVLELPDKFKEMEPAAQAVRIKAAYLALDCEKSRNKLEKALSGDKVSVSLGEKNDASFWIGGNKLELTKTLGCGKDDTINIFHQEESPRVEAVVSHAEGDTVWLRLEELEVGRRMMEVLQDKSRRQSKAGKVHVGDLVIARYSQDRRQYRARVTQQLGGHRVEVTFIDFGNKEVLEAGWLKALPGELRLCPGLAMRCSVENSGECRLVSGHELTRDIGHVTADLAQPRGSLVRLWARGQRLGIMTSGSVALPRLRLRLGDTWLGLLCSGGNTKQLSVLDITRACHVRELLEFYQTNIDVTQPVSGHVYCSTGGGVRRRVSVRDLGRAQLMVTELDTGTSVKLEPGLAALETLSPRAMAASPALVTCQPHSRDGARYEVPDTLLMVNVTDHNSLRLVQVTLRVSPTFKEGIKVPNVTKMSLTSGEENMMTVELPSGSWSSNDLVHVRDMLLLSSLGIQSHPVTNIESPENVLDSVNITEASFKVVSEIRNVKRMNNFFHHENISQKSFVTQIQTDGDTLKITFHPALPPIQVPLEKPSEFRILSLTESLSTLKVAADSAPVSLSGDNLESVETVKEGELCLYKEGGDTPVQRARVISVMEEDSVAEVVNIDTGAEVICHFSELFRFPEELTNTPASVLTAHVRCDKSVLQPGDMVIGKMSVSADNSKLELHVLE